MSRIATSVGILAVCIGASAAWAQSGEFTAPRTSFGHPDLSGTWTNNNATPLQRPAQWADKELLTDAELAAVQSKARNLEADGDALFGDEYFADLFKRSTLGRPTVAARVVATVMLLQAYEGLSDREACDRLAFDLRWKAAAGLAGGGGIVSPHGAGRDAQPAACLGSAATVVRGCQRHRADGGVVAGAPPGD